MCEDTLIAVSRYDDVDLCADENEKVVRDIAHPVQILALDHSASNAQLSDERNIGVV
jgi:hypothetical protein